MVEQTIKLKIISAKLDEKEAAELIETNYGILPQSIHRLDGYDDVNFRILRPIETVENDGQTKLHEDGYVLKIIHWSETSEEFIDKYLEVLIHLKKERFPCPYPVKTKAGGYKSYWTSNEPGLKNYAHVVILLEYFSGSALKELPFNIKLCYSLGEFIGRLHSILKPFRNSEILQRPNFIWRLDSVSQVLQLMDTIEEQDQRTLITNVVEEFESQVIPNIHILESGTIHGDINEGNIIVSTREKEPKIVGIIDFCDMSNSCYLFDLAIAIAYLTLMSSEYDVAEVAAAIILRYRRSLTDLEFTLLRICICARLCQSLVIGLHTFAKNPSNNYLLITQKKGWYLLKTLYLMEIQKFLYDVRINTRRFE